MIKAVVGAGGKTTWIKNQAKKYVSQGKKVLVLTSTHMWIEQETLLTDDADEIIQKLEKDHYVMAGVRVGQKMTALPKTTYDIVCKYADEVLIEADGSRHLPLKYPNEHEPVIYENVEEIIVVYGPHAIGKAAKEVIHRFELAKQNLSITEETLIQESHIRMILSKGYLEPLKKKYPQKKIRIQEGTKQNMQIGCIIMASGISKRFGENKLLLKFSGQSLIQRVLDMTKDAGFAQCIVLTRSKEVQEICEKQQQEVFLHTLPTRNEAIRFGVQMMQRMDAVLFCPCDQPMLTTKSLDRMINCFQKESSGIVRLAYGMNVGTPILFGKEYFEELLKLPDKCGGSYLAKKYSQQVKHVMADEEMELFDIDTKEDFEKLETYRIEKEREKGEESCLQ